MIIYVTYGYICYFFCVYIYIYTYVYININKQTYVYTHICCYESCMVGWEKPWFCSTLALELNGHDTILAQALRWENCVFSLAAEKGFPFNGCSYWAEGWGHWPSHILPYITTAVTAGSGPLHARLSQLSPPPPPSIYYMYQGNKVPPTSSTVYTDLVCPRARVGWGAGAIYVYIVYTYVHTYVLCVHVEVLRDLVSCGVAVYI